MLTKPAMGIVLKKGFDLGLGRGPRLSKVLRMSP